MEPSNDTNRAAAALEGGRALPPSMAPADAPPAEADTEIIIRPRRGWIGIEWAELVRYRELLYFLVWRDFKVKYRQAILGFAWSVVVPMLSLAIYAVAASLTNASSTLESGTPLTVWLFAGLIPWLFLQRSINDGGSSLLANQALMTKVYLPRVYLPAASCANGFVDMAINLGLLALLCVVFAVTHGFVPSWQIIFLPPLILLAFIAGFGVALLLSAATVLYRDLRFLTPFISQFGLWMSGVIFPIEHFGKWQYLFAINPFTGIVYGFRSAVTGEPWPLVHLASSIVMSCAMLVLGLFYFRRVERRFADIA